MVSSSCETLGPFQIFYLFYYSELYSFPKIALAGTFLSRPLFWHQRPDARMMLGHLTQALHLTDQKMGTQKDKVIFPVSELGLELKTPDWEFPLQFFFPTPLYQQ